MNRRIAIPTAALLFLLLAGEASARPGGYEENEDLGYKVRYPADWEKMPLKVEERWIASKYLSDRDFFDKEEGYPFKPDMRVIVFPFSVTDDRGVKRTDSSNEENKTTVIEIKNPYKDYKDYLKRNYSGGGWFVSLEEEQEDKDVKWTLMEIKVEKLAYGGKKRIIAGVFHQEDADFVVQFEILEDSYAKLKSTVYGCLKSFRFIPRQGSLAPETTEGIDLTDESKLTPDERKKRRLDRQTASFRKAVEAAPDGWESFEYKGFLVISHVDRKYAMKVVTQAEAVRKWLEKTFPFMGSEYVRPAIIRICKDLDEERAYFDGSGDAWLSAAREIITHKDQSAGSASWEFEYVNRRVVSGWFYDKNPDLQTAMPDWIALGLGQYVGTGSLKGSRMQFKPDEWEKTRLREADKGGELKPIKEMLLMSSDEFKGHHQSQSAALLRYLLDGPGRGMKGAKTFLEDYFAALDAVVREMKAEEEKEKAPESGPKTEEEEEEQFRNRRNKWKEAEKKLLQEVFDRTFGGWKESSWDSFEASFRKYVS